MTAKGTRMELPSGATTRIFVPNWEFPQSNTYVGSTRHKLCAKGAPPLLSCGRIGIGLLCDRFGGNC